MPSDGTGCVIQLGLIGCGYWGPNLLRNFQTVSGCSVKWACDLDSERLQRIHRLYPSVQITQRAEDILDDLTVDAVAIATPVVTHHPLALRALGSGKHVLVEKPLARSVAQCEDLKEVAERLGRVLMVGHTFEYSPSVRKVKEIIDSGHLGKINYVSASRLNLGIFQRDINVVWDLAPHDFSIILYLLEKFPESVSCEGTSHYRPDIEDVAISTLKFGDGLAAFVQSSWLDPNKVRQITIVGTSKMLLYDDVSPNEKVKIFDKGVDVPPRYDTFGEFQFAYRYGDISIPRVEETEPLRLECEHFVECIRRGRRPQTDVDNGTRVVRILEACEQSLRTGLRVNLSEPAVKTAAGLGASTSVAAIRDPSRGVDETTI